ANSRNGISEIDFSSATTKDHAQSLFTQMGITADGYFLAEYAVRDIRSAGSASRRELGFAGFGYELHRGIIPFVIYEHQAITDADSLTQKYSAGLRLYPITHFEFMGQWGVVDSKTGSDTVHGQAAFLMANMFF